MLKWIKSAKYQTGATTLASVLAAIVTAIDTQSQHWQVNYSSANTVELKPVAHTAARLMICGGSSPHASSLLYGTASTDRIYTGFSSDANTPITGPTTAYTAGDPYSGTTHTKLVPSHSGVSVLATNYVEFYECEDAIVIRVYLNVGPTSIITCGKLLNPYQDWILSVAHSAPSNPQHFPRGTNYWFPIAMLSDVASIEGYPRTLALINGSTYDIGYSLGFISRSGADDVASTLQTDTDYVFHPIPMAGKLYGTSNLNNYLGVMRQIKIGPATLNGTLIKASGIEQSYYIASLDTIIGAGVHLDMFE